MVSNHQEGAGYLREPPVVHQTPERFFYWMLPVITKHYPSLNAGFGGFFFSSRSSFPRERRVFGIPRESCVPCFHSAARACCL